MNVPEKPETRLGREPEESGAQRHRNQKPPSPNSSACGACTAVVIRVRVASRGSGLDTPCLNLVTQIQIRGAKCTIAISSLFSRRVIIGCATAFQPQGFTDGYRDQRIDDNTVQVGFRGNGFKMIISITCLSKARE